VHAIRRLMADPVGDGYAARRGIEVKRVSPRLFRMSAATTAATLAGTTPHIASALLDHRESKTTQEHYNNASSLSAGKE